MLSFNYLAMGILVGCLTPYALMLIKPKADQTQETNDDEDY